MRDMLALGNAWITQQRHEHMTRTVLYRRGGQSIQIEATVGQTDIEQIDEDGLLHRARTRDFLIRSIDLIMDGLPTTPEQGDEVLETVNGSTSVYEVNAPAGLTPWKYSDPSGTTIRVRTIRTGAEA